MMNYSSCYTVHNSTMDTIKNRFNELSNNDNVFMIDNRRETYTNDGSFLLSDLGVAVGFDWEWRKTGYPTLGEFKYQKWGLSQYGTKLAKPSIKVSLQISQDLSGILVAFHEDFDLFADVKLSSETKVNREERVGRTFDYIEIPTTDEGLILLKEILQRAAATQTYNHTAFAA